MSVRTTRALKVRRRGDMNDDDDDDFGDFATPMTTTTTRTTRRLTFVDDEGDGETPTGSSNEEQEEEEEDFGEFTTPRTDMTPYAVDATPQPAESRTEHAVESDGERGGLLDLICERDDGAFGERTRTLLRATWNANVDEKAYDEFKEFMQSLSTSIPMSKEDTRRLFSIEAFAEFTKLAKMERDARNDSDSEDLEPAVVPENTAIEDEVQIRADVPITPTPQPRALVEEMDLISLDATNVSAPKQASADPFTAMTTLIPIEASAGLMTENCDENDEDEFGEFI